jgi:hypothetical protein
MRRFQGAMALLAERNSETPGGLQNAHSEFARSPGSGAGPAVRGRRPAHAAKSLAAVRRLALRSTPYLMSKVRASLPDGSARTCWNRLPCNSATG